MCFTRAGGIDAHSALRLATADVTEGRQTRISSVDLLRGLVMVVMALDHTRDFFGASGLNPRVLGDPALFLTRWITHYCAPTFILLAGVSSYLYGARVRSVHEVSRFLLTRGFWLILIEFTLVRLGWSFSFNLTYFTAGVIWVIGASMVVLAGLVYLPRWAIATFSLVMITGHNLLDGVHAADLGAGGWIWNVLHEPMRVTLVSGATVSFLYSLIPWVGVMAAGYALGPVLQLNQISRRPVLMSLGIAITVGFVLLRATNRYGDPSPWSPQSSWLSTVLSFINCEKYPPSLLYLMMTLGPALILLTALEGARGRLAEWMTTFGRVPLLYYVAHIFLIHALAVVYAVAVLGDRAWLLGQGVQKPVDYGLGLLGVYAVWLLVVVALYPLCHWFAGLKRRRREWWLSYL
jgi:uncharacterized membrane protein